MRRALIVDDSKTAQIRLKKLLGKYDLVVDTALSGEDALTYLDSRTPVVIFMDHSMDGMDGLEALKIIKSNPSTAMIPVIMYTAQRGDVYLGQARALGAADILSKEVIKASNLERVLGSLKIIPTSASSEVPPLEASNDESLLTQDNSLLTQDNSLLVQDSSLPVQDSSESIEIVNNSGHEEDSGQLESQVARLVETHIADVRTQITENTKYIVRSLSKEMGKKQPDEVESLDVPADIVEQEVQAERNRIGIISSSLLVLILLSLIYLTWNLQHTQDLLVDARVAATNIDTPPTVNNSNELSLAINEMLGLKEQLTSLQVNQQKLLHVLTWALDTDLSFGFTEAPLGDAQVNKLYSLAYMLESAGYRGTMQLNIHLGNYCLQRAPSGAWAPAEPDTPAADCVMRGSLGQDFMEEDFLSVEYLNFEQTAAPLINGSLDIEINLVGMTQPRYNYPQPLSEVASREWNRIAAANNRISLVLQ